MENSSPDDPSTLTRNIIDGIRDSSKITTRAGAANSHSQPLIIIGGKSKSGWRFLKPRESPQTTLFWYEGASLRSANPEIKTEKNDKKESEVEKEPLIPHINDMTVSREEINAKLEAIEARMDSRVAGMSAKLDATLAEIRADRVRFTQLEADLREVKGDLKAFPDRIDAKLQSNAVNTDAQIKGLKTNIWFGVATTIASVGATIAIAISSFDSGRETSKSISEATVKMEKIQAQLDAAAKSQTPAPAPAAKP